VGLDCKGVLFLLHMHNDTRCLLYVARLHGRRKVQRHVYFSGPRWRRIFLVGKLHDCNMLVW